MIKPLQDQFTYLQTRNKWKMRNKSRGLCMACGKSEVIKGLCELHRKKQSEATRAWAKRKAAIDPEWVAKRAAYAKKWRRENHEAINQRVREKRAATKLTKQRGLLVKKSKDC